MPSIQSSASSSTTPICWCNQDLEPKSQKRCWRRTQEFRILEQLPTSVIFGNLIHCYWQSPYSVQLQVHINWLWWIQCYAENLADFHWICGIYMSLGHGKPFEKLKMLKESLTSSWLHETYLFSDGESKDLHKSTRKLFGNKPWETYFFLVYNPGKRVSWGCCRSELLKQFWLT